MGSGEGGRRMVVTEGVWELGFWDVGALEGGWLQALSFLGVLGCEGRYMLYLHASMINSQGTTPF